MCNQSSRSKLTTIFFGTSVCIDLVSVEGKKFKFSYSETENRFEIDSNFLISKKLCEALQNVEGVVRVYNHIRYTTIVYIGTMFNKCEVSAKLTDVLLKFKEPLPIIPGITGSMRYL